MSTSGMAHRRPPSPPSSHNGELLQNGFQRLLQHNASTLYPHDALSYENGTPITSGTHSSFGSPAASLYQDYDLPKQPFTYQCPDVGLGIRYDGYSNQPNPHDMRFAPYANEHQMYGGRYDTPARSPAPTVTSTPSSDAKESRSEGRSLRTLKTLPQESPTKSPRPRRTKKPKPKAEKKVVELTQALSILTKNWDHVPVADIEAYVNRPVEERRKEIETGKNPGKIKRPMNSFMLYRKAYQNRTKVWCLENNHQVVSQVCGDSWPLEPEEVRNQFNEWARIERINHANAHPGYKFTPSKGVIIKPTKRKTLNKDDSEESDLDDFEWQPPRGNKKLKSISSRKPEYNGHFAPTSAPYDYSRESSLATSMNGYHRSSYEASNPESQPPPQYDQSTLQPGQYFEQVIRANTSMPNVEDVIIQKRSAPGSEYLTYAGGHEYIMREHYAPSHHTLASDDRIDPSLISHNGTPYDEGYIHEPLYFCDDRLDTPSDWSTPYGMTDHIYHLQPEMHGFADHFHALPIPQEHLELLKGTQDGWTVETLDPGQEFDKWMEETS